MIIFLITNGSQTPVLLRYYQILKRDVKPLWAIWTIQGTAEINPLIPSKLFSGPRYFQIILLNVWTTFSYAVILKENQSHYQEQPY